MKFVLEGTLSELVDMANNSERKRQHLNLHSSFEEKVQRLLIALVKGSYVEPHYHALEHQWEMFIVLRGVVKIELFDELGNVISSELVGENCNSLMVVIEPNEIHSVRCISDSALLLEIKEGPFKPENAKVFPSFDA